MKPAYFKYVNTFFVVTPMTFVVAICGLISNESYHDKGWIPTLLISWLTVLPVAYLFALIIIPLANKLTKLTVNNKS
jgi:hypothetical protein